MSTIKEENKDYQSIIGLDESIIDLADQVKASFNSTENPVAARNYLIQISQKFPTVIKHNRCVSSDIFKNENIPNINSEIEFDSFEIYNNVEFDGILARTMSISNFPTFQKYFQKYAAFRTRGSMKSIHLKFKFIDQVDPKNYDKTINTIPFPLERKRKIAKKRTFETSSCGSSSCGSSSILDQKIPKTETIAPISSNIIFTTLPANHLQTQIAIPTQNSPIDHSTRENSQFSLLANLCQANQREQTVPINLDLTMISTLLNMIQKTQA
jgi:hypothetical protein